MTELIFFILGIIFISFIVPLGDGLLSLLLTWIETKKAKHAQIINDANIKISKDALSSADDECFTVSGFASNLTQEEEDDDDL